MITQTHESKASTDVPTGPLAGLTVLELGHFIAAPFCTRLLADLGATVIKVEPPGDGDPVRTWGEMVDGRSVWWSVHGRNKKSITINLKSPEGRQLVLDLVRRSRIVVENYKPGQLERWGLGPDVMASVNPAVSSCGSPATARRALHTAIRPSGSSARRSADCAISPTIPPARPSSLRCDRRQSRRQRGRDVRRHGGARRDARTGYLRRHPSSARSTSP